DASGPRRFGTPVSAQLVGSLHPFRVRTYFMDVSRTQGIASHSLRSPWAGSPRPFRTHRMNLSTEHARVRTSNGGDSGADAVRPAGILGELDRNGAESVGVVISRRNRYPGARFARRSPRAAPWTGMPCDAPNSLWPNTGPTSTT